MEEIASYNKEVLQTLGAKQVKRSTVKYKTGSSFPCKACDLSAHSLLTLKKHKDKVHASTLQNP